SGKSSLLRAAAEQLGAVDAFALPLPDAPLIDALPGTIDERLATLAGCGLSEARLLLRTPAELSEGQRYRFRLAFALAVTVANRQSTVEGRDVPSTVADVPRTHPSEPARQLPTGDWLLADEFTAALDRTLAKVVAFNLRKLASRTGVGVLAATTYE